MPDNQKNTADENELNFINDPEYTSGPRLNTIPKLDPSTNEVNKNYISAFQNQLSFAESNDEAVRPYIISYKTVVMNQNDETYTYIDSTPDIDSSGKSYHITGYNRNTSYLNIPQSFTKKLIAHENDKEIPILINKFIASQYGLKVGSTFQGSINNDVDRFDTSEKAIDKPFKVQGILNSYDDNRMFTLQSIANNVTGLSKYGPNAFNGVFTKQDNPTVLSNLPLYSPSGLYLPTDTLSGQ